MSTETEKIPARSPSPAAERMRRFRRRRRNGMVCVRVQLGVADVDALVTKRYLNPKKREDLSAVAEAADGFLSDALQDLIGATAESSE
jgi:hypothetical protein